ncbi:unnamed protein product [Bursaphelenchus xylophilus]|uniref:(pine wood nematode) hypothetical protein n=1 Tax=Bursaphelenchus xylophilus TaxID=6326 RepID=A0A1I7SCJ8_BURXY|nr:unnamed protein product [Bursaphelenchus xylophilus]CAG9093976.1 unnamed protein product [Bursaphelenchus xylophilus]
MAFNTERVTTAPNVIKLYCLVGVLVIIFSVGAASVQPAGTGFVWSIAIANLVLGIIQILILGVEIDDIVFPRRGFFSWPLLECIVSIFFAITHFISIWMCANGANQGAVTAYTLAGIFSFIVSGAHVFNTVIFGQIWAAEQQNGPGQDGLIQFHGSSYGAP